MSISASLIKELRDKTGAGMSDCKNALDETNADIEEAIAWLRKKGLASAGKKAGRETSEGAIAAFVDGNRATMIELSSETDFVGKNEKFLGLVATVVKNAHHFGDDAIAKFLEHSIDGSSTINELIAEHISIIGENIVLKRLCHLNVQNGKVLSYFHNKLADNTGKIGVLVALEGDVNEEIEEFGKQLAMHIAASKPAALNLESLDQNLVEKEKDILRSQALESGKSPDVVEKMIEGRIRKFLEEIVLLEQPFVMDGKTKIKKIIEDLESKNNCKFTVSGYVRYEVGEN